MLGLVHKVLNWLLAAGDWSLAAGRWSLVAGRLSLVAGHWSLVSGCWSLVSDFGCQVSAPPLAAETASLIDKETFACFKIDKA